MGRLIICKECGQEKPHYGKGLCRPCCSHRWYEENKERILAQDRHHYQIHREQQLARRRHYYETHREMERAYCQEHREERAIYRRQWQKNNPEKRAGGFARRQAYKHSLPDTLTPEQAERLLVIGRTMYPGEELHLDHIVPLSKGGGTTWANMHAIPGWLNDSNGDALPREAYCQLSFV